MKRVAKVAVSIPADTLKSMERTRARLQRTRSAVVTEAIERWLSAEDVGEDEQRYMDGYLRHPERVDEIAVVAAEVTGGWERWQ